MASVTGTNARGCWAAGCEPVTSAVAMRTTAKTDCFMTGVIFAHVEVVRHTVNQGWIEVIVGSMFSGKSEELIRRLRRAQIARQKVQIFKPAVDTRYGAGHIVSHSDMRIESTTVASAEALLAATTLDTEVVGIDEGQFFDTALPAV